MASDTGNGGGLGEAGAIGTELFASLLEALSRGCAVTLRPGDTHIKILDNQLVHVEVADSAGAGQSRTIPMLQLKVPIVGEQLLARTVADLST
jgi:hypothetical protein